MIEKEYKIETGSDYIIITKPQGNPVCIRLFPHFVMAEEVHGQGRNVFGFFDHHDLAGWIDATAMKDRESFGKTGGDISRADGQVVKTLHGKIKAGVDHLVEKADDKVIAVHRAIARVRGSSRECRRAEERLEFNPVLYTDKYLVSDIINYRACALAVFNIVSLAPYPSRNVFAAVPRDLVSDYMDYHTGYDNPMKSGGFITGSFDSQLNLFNQIQTRQRHIYIPGVFDALENWKGLYSFNGEPYRSLNRTLMNLPHSIPASLPALLRFVKLTRPLVRRTEFIFSVLSGELLFHYRGIYNDSLASKYSIFLNAHSGDIQKVMNIISKYFNIRLDERKTADVSRAIDFLFSYIETCSFFWDPEFSSLIGCAKNAVSFFQDFNRARNELVFMKYGHESELSRPPVPLPDKKGISFISTIGNLIEEGTQMNHCIASCVKSAILGKSYLFHVEYRDDHASVEVNSDGRIIQSFGPVNSDNKASQWGKKVLNDWGKKLADENIRGLSHSFDDNRIVNRLKNHFAGEPDK